MSGNVSHWSSVLSALAVRTRPSQQLRQLDWLQAGLQAGPAIAWRLRQTGCGRLSICILTLCLGPRRQLVSVKWLQATPNTARHQVAAKWQTGSGCS